MSAYVLMCGCAYVSSPSNRFLCCYLLFVFHFFDFMVFPNMLSICLISNFVCCAVLFSFRIEKWTKKLQNINIIWARKKWKNTNWMRTTTNYYMIRRRRHLIITHLLRSFHFNQKHIKMFGMKNQNTNKIRKTEKKVLLLIFFFLFRLFGVDFSVPIFLHARILVVIKKICFLDFSISKQNLIEFNWSFWFSFQILLWFCFLIYQMSFDTRSILEHLKDVGKKQKKECKFVIIIILVILIENDYFAFFFSQQKQLNKVIMSRKTVLESLELSTHNHHDYWQSKCIWFMVFLVFIMSICKINTYPTQTVYFSRRRWVSFFSCSLFIRQIFFLHA